VPEGSYYEPSYVNVAEKMANALRINKDLRVLIANGYYDLITPFYDAEFTFSRFGILPERVTMTYHEAGHMMYLHEAEFNKLNAEVRKFITQQTKN
jgi:carboxypeptidase C (cathepsin A)